MTSIVRQAAQNEGSDGGAGLVGGWVEGRQAGEPVPKISCSFSIN